MTLKTVLYFSLSEDLTEISIDLAKHNVNSRLFFKDWQFLTDFDTFELKNCRL